MLFIHLIKEFVGAVVDLLKVIVIVLVLIGRALRAILREVSLGDPRYHKRSQEEAEKGGKDKNKNDGKSPKPPGIDTYG